MFRVKSEDDWMSLDMQFLTQLWQIYRTDSTVTACANLLRGRLVGLGVMFLSETSSTVPKEWFFEFVTKYYSKFCNEAMEQLIVMGFCAYTLPPTDGRRKHVCPSVIPFGRGTYMMRYDKYHRASLGFVRNDETEAKVDKKVLFMTLTPPDFTGRACSNVASAYSVQAFKRQLELNTLYADRVLARPPVLTQSKADTTFDDRDLIGLSSRDPEVGAAKERKNQLWRNMMTAETWKQQTQLMRLLNANNVDTSSSAWQSRVDPVTGLPVFTADDEDVYQPSFIPMPHDTTVAQMHLPSRPPEFVATQQYVMQHTCMCMGVSPQLLVGVGSSMSASSGVVQLSDTTLMLTVMKYRMCITETLLNIYSIAFGNGSSDGVQVVFPAAQRPDNIMDMYERGYITYEHFIVEYCRWYGLPKGAFNETPQPPLQMMQQQLLAQQQQQQQQPVRPFFPLFFFYSVFLRRARRRVQTRSRSARKRSVTRIAHPRSQGRSRSKRGPLEARNVRASQTQEAGSSSARMASSASGPRTTRML